jgi:hypothetical protein
MKQNPTDDELLRSYLLAELPDEEADRLERRLLAEDELFELAEAVEADLLAACDRGELAPAERERVLQRLASSPRGRERLALARSLNTAARTAARDLPGTAPRTVVPFQRRTPAPARPALRWAALAASLLAVAGLSWYAVERPRGGESAPWIAQERPAPAHAVKAPAPAPAAHPALSKAVFPLALMGLRGAEPARRLRVPPGTDVVELQIALEGMDELESFHVTLRNATAGTSLDQAGLKPKTLDGARALVVDLPAERLPAGRYEIQIQGTAPGGAPEELSPLEIEVVKGSQG